MPEQSYHPMGSGPGKRRQASVDNRDIRSVNPLRSQPSNFFSSSPRDTRRPSVPKSAIGIALGSPAKPQKAASRKHDINIQAAPQFSTPDYTARTDQGGAGSQPGMLQRRPSKWGKLGSILRKKEPRPQSPSIPLQHQQAATGNLRDNDEALRPAPLRIRASDASNRDPSKAFERANSTGSACGPPPRKATAHVIPTIAEVPLPSEIESETSGPQHLNAHKPAPTLLNIDIPSVKLERYSVMFADVLKSEKRTSLLGRRQATLEQRRSRRASHFKLSPLPAIKNGPLPPTPEDEPVELNVKSPPKSRSVSRERKCSAVSTSDSRSSSADRRPAVRNASRRSSVRELPPPPNSPLPAVPCFNLPLSPTPFELPSLSLLSSPSSAVEVKCPETPGKRPAHDRSTSLPSISPVLVSSGFDHTHHLERVSSIKNSQIVVLVHSPSKELPELPTLYENEPVKNARMSLTPNRLEFVGKDLLRGKTSVQLGSSVTVTGRLGSELETSGEMSLARQVSMRRRQLLLPILNRNQQHREQLAAEAERLGSTKDLKPRLVDLRHTEGRRSQRVELECV
ncbi:MAG: hypothetical protein M1814_004406 [Vezdaea aestivalis]|nr:MAG: hypothetical protein M1814_004406 [Vezdaea aestivalis]